MYYKSNSKNNVEQSRLNAELKNLERQKKNELRMHDSEAQRFKAKHSNNISSDNVSEAVGVKMYQTHNPGFCYKRNGDHKTPITPCSSPFLELAHLRNLIFTNEDLDVEKIVCLHLLSTHQTETLKMPTIEEIKELNKENSPIERLIQRSKRINKEKKDDKTILKLLPTYVIDIGLGLSATTIDMTKTEKVETYKDSRLSSKLLINGKVQEILTLALEALRKSKSEKLLKIAEYFQDDVCLKRLFSKLSMQDYLKMLANYSIITSCECYYLTPKIKEEPSHLELRTIFGNLESLILQIRQQILQNASRAKNEWKCPCFLAQIIEDDEKENDAVSFASQPQNSIETKFSKLNKSSKLGVSKSIISGQKSELMSVSSIGRRAYKNFIIRNIQAVKGESVTRKVFEDVEHDRLSVRTLDSNLSKILHRDYCPENLRFYAAKEPETKIPDEEQKIETKSEIIPETASFIKRSCCCACQEKWKLPRPSPKIPSYTRPGLAPEFYKNPYSTNEMNQLSSKIKEELYILNSYDTRYCTGNVNAKIKMPKNSSLLSLMSQNEISNNTESIELNPYDLMKIELEIAERETCRKLGEFLRETV